MNKLNIASISTPTHTSSPRHTPMLQLNNVIQSGAQVHRPEPQQLHVEQLQQLQNLQQYFKSQQQIQTSALSSTPTPASLPIPQLVAQAHTPRITTPMPVAPSNASFRSNTPSISNLQIKGTENVLNAVSASLVYVGVNKNGSQNITPATSKPPSVKSEVEPAVMPHHHFVHNISIPDIGSVYESVADNNNDNNDNNNNNNNDNIVIDILPLTHDNLNIHENTMIQQQQELSPQVEIPNTTTELPIKIPILPLVFDQFDPEGMM